MRKLKSYTQFPMFVSTLIVTLCATALAPSLHSSSLASVLPAPSTTAYTAKKKRPLAFNIAMFMVAKPKTQEARRGFFFFSETKKQEEDKTEENVILALMGTYYLKTYVSIKLLLSPFSIFHLPLHTLREEVFIFLFFFFLVNVFDG